jgi:hypothetical protein
MQCKLIIKDEVNAKFEGLSADTRRALVRKFSFELPYARHLPAVRLGRWDGRVNFFQLSGSTYINLLPEILPYLDDLGYDVELLDARDYQTHFVFSTVSEDSYSDRTWPEKHQLAGQPILLRDHQVTAINNFLSNTQSLQSIVTGAGKCLDFNTEIDIEFDENSDFGKFLVKIPRIPCVNQMKISIKIGQLLSAMAEYKQTILENNQEVDVKDLGVNIKTPTLHYEPIQHIIKKQSTGVKLSFQNGKSLICADNHILYDLDFAPCHAKKFNPGDYLRTIYGVLEIQKAEPVPMQEWYDVSIPSPHVYCDSAGILHHNTLVTSVLSHQCEKYGRTLLIVPNKSLVLQTEVDYRNLGLDVGVYFGDRKELGHKHTIATWQSLNNLLKNTKSGDAEVTIHEFIQDVVCVIIDEAHNQKSEALKSLMSGPLAQIPIRWGLTGTIPREDFDFYALRVCIGEVVGRVTASELQEKGILANCEIKVLQLVDFVEYRDYQSELKYLVDTEERLRFLARKIEEIAQTGNTLVLLDRISTGNTLTDLIPGAVFVKGKTKTQDRKDHYDQIAVSDNLVTVATFGVASTGIDVPRLHNVVLLEPGKSFVRVIQSIGRGLRKAHDKDSVVIWDITSTCKFSKRHLTKRKQYYQEAQYPFNVQKVNWQ